MTTLSSLAADLASGAIQVIDLTAPLATRHRSSSCRPSSARPRGSSWRRSAATTTAARPGTGTTSAPASTPAPTSTPRTTGSPARTATTSPRCRPRRLIAPAAVLDFSGAGRRGPRLPAGDRRTSRRGRPSTARCRTAAGCSYRTGWDARSTTRTTFLNADETGPHTPGHLGRVRPLGRRGVAGDRPRRRDGRHRRRRRALVRPGVPVPLATCMGNGKYGLTQLQNLAPLPPTGAVVVAGPLPIVGGLGQPGARRWPWSSERDERRARPSAGRCAAWASTQVFGVVGSGNFHVTNALVAAGARFVAARHEGGAATMADAYARMSGTVAALSRAPGMRADQRDDRHRRGGQEPHAAARAGRRGRPSRGPTSTSTRRRWRRAVGAVADARHVAGDAVADAVAACRPAARTSGARCCSTCRWTCRPRGAAGRRRRPAGAAASRAAAADRRTWRHGSSALSGRERPVFVAGRGARAGRAPRGAGRARRPRAARCSRPRAVAKGLFHGNPWSLDVSGGFASPLAAELIRDADLIVGWGCALNMWTMRHGRLIGAGRHGRAGRRRPRRARRPPPIDLGVLGDVADDRARAALGGSPAARARATGPTSRRPDRRARCAGATCRTRTRRHASTASTRAPSRIALDDLLPADRVVGVDSGNFMGYPSMFLSVPDEHGFCFTQAFQSIGLGLATAIGAALAQPDRLAGRRARRRWRADGRRRARHRRAARAADGRRRLQRRRLRRRGAPLRARRARLDTVQFPPTDIAAIGRGYRLRRASPCARASDLDAVDDVAGRDRRLPLLIDAKVVRDRPSWWLEEAFRGH